MRICPLVAQTLHESPLVLVDVGARGGLPKKWQPLRRSLIAVGFEPDAVEYERLRAKAHSNDVYINKALYSSSTKVLLYCTRNPNCSSIYRPNTSLLEQLGRDHGQLEVEKVDEILASTLDEELGNEGIMLVDFIKVDTQGSELDVLQGAEKTLSNGPFGLEVEVEFAPLYSGQPLFPDLYRFVTERDFIFMGFSHMSYDSSGYRSFSGTGALIRSWIENVISLNGSLRGAKRLVYADAVFFRSPQSWLRHAQEWGDVEARLTKAVLVCCATNYYGYALRLIVTACDNKAVDGSLGHALRELVSSESRSAQKVVADLRRGVSHVKYRLMHPTE